MRSPIRVHDFETWSTSISFLVGYTPKVTMVCGECYYTFSKRFRPIDFRSGYPRALCPSCGRLNYVPLTVE